MLVPGLPVPYSVIFCDFTMLQSSIVLLHTIFILFFVRKPLLIHSTEMIMLTECIRAVHWFMWLSMQFCLCCSNGEVLFVDVVLSEGEVHSFLKQ